MLSPHEGGQQNLRFFGYGYILGSADICTCIAFLLLYKYDKYLLKYMLVWLSKIIVSSSTEYKENLTSNDVGV